jgi:hypothetical protein
MSRLLLAILLLMNLGVAYPEMYQWVDEKGEIYFSNQKPSDKEAGVVVLKPGDVISHDKSDIDKFTMPSQNSKVPHIFVMTSAMNRDEPADRLKSINMTLRQKSFFSYIKLTDIESGKDYNMRVRILDGEGELVFDKRKTLNSKTNSVWFSARITPSINIDEPGLWTIQGILNNKKLFIEKREVLF